LTSEPGGNGGSEEGSTAEAMPALRTSEPGVQASEAETPTEAGPHQAGGKRTQLKIMRENLQSLSREVESLRKSHEARTSKLEKEVVSLRKELATMKGHSLRSELVELKKHITKETARGRKQQEATLSRILAKVSAKPKPAGRPKK
jgi:hypothetical protein